MSNPEPAQNNVKTAAEYQAAADEITAIINAQRASRAPIEAEQTLLQNRAELLLQRQQQALNTLRAAEADPSDTAFLEQSRLAYNRATGEVNTVNTAIQQNRSVLAQSRQSTAELQEQRGALEVKAEFAERGPPNLNSLPPPATTVPNQTATFVPTPPNPIPPTITPALQSVAAAPTATASAQNNVTTAAEWEQTADEISSAQRQLRAENLAITENTIALKSQYNQATQADEAARSELIRAQNSGASPETIARLEANREATRQQASALENQIQKNESVLGSNQQTLGQLDESRAIAEQAYDQARTGDPNANSVPPPATIIPGEESTAVELSSTSPPSNFTPTLLSDAELLAIYPETDPQEIGAIRGTTIITDEARRIMSDPVNIQRQLDLEDSAVPPILPIVTTRQISDDEASRLLDEAENPPAQNNAKTAAEWEQTADEISSAQRQLRAENLAIAENTAALKSQYNQATQADEAARSELIRAENRGAGPEEIARLEANREATRQQASALESQIQKNEDAIGQNQQTLGQLDESRAIAEQAYDQAIAGNPTLNSVPPPATIIPGQNATTIELEPAGPPPVFSPTTIQGTEPSPLEQSSQNNVKTAAQWEQTADDISSAQRQLRAENLAIAENTLVLKAEYNQATQADEAARSELIRAQNSGASPEEIARLEAAREETRRRASQLENQIQTNEDAIGQNQQTLGQLDESRSIAEQAYDQAITGDPNLNSVPPPVGVDLGATQAEADFILAEQQLQIETELGATQLEADFIRTEEQLQIETELGATQAEADFIRTEEQLQIETELGATQAEADAIARAQLEADQNEYAFGGTQAEADFINEQKAISDQEAALGAAGATEDEAAAINRALLAQEEEAGGISSSNRQGISEARTNAQSQATQQDQAQFNKQEDWRVRLSLSPTANYLYKAKNPGILKPLADTNGVIFPYTPSIQIAYAATYDTTDLIHSNYKVFQYKNSSVDSINITCDFTAQDTNEANYLLAVIHFFRTVTKMFYGQDNNPKPGTPPPLCFLTGLGVFQFNEHPLAITSFNYSLPADVDYIRAGQVTSLAGVNQSAASRPVNTYNVSETRLNNLKTGGNPPDTRFNNGGNSEANVTYVPTKMQIQIGCLPMLSRNDISNNFSLNDYASGRLLRGLQNVRGGFW